MIVTDSRKCSVLQVIVWRKAALGNSKQRAETYNLITTAVFAPFQKSSFVKTHHNNFPLDS